MRRATDDGEGPDGVLSSQDRFDLKDGKIVREGVIAEMVAERPFRELPMGIDRPDDGEVGLRGDGKTIGPLDERESMAAQNPRETELTHPLGQGHDGGNRQRRWAADGNHHSKTFASLDGSGMMDADAPMKLVVESDFAVGGVLIPIELNAIHA